MFLTKDVAGLFERCGPKRLEYDRFLQKHRVDVKILKLKAYQVIDVFCAHDKHETMNRREREIGIDISIVSAAAKTSNHLTGEIKAIIDSKHGYCSQILSRNLM